MKAIALLPHTKNVQLVDWPEPKIEAETEVKVRVLEAGICRSHQEEMASGRAQVPKGEPFLIIGHEVLGQVVKIGKKVKRVKVGDFVAVMVRRPCAECPMCEKDSADLCQSGNYTERGLKEHHGFQTEFIVDEEKYLVKIPEAIRPIGVLTHSTTLVGKAIDQACRLQATRLPVNADPKKWCEGKKALVIGLGPLGLLAAAILRLRGAEATGIDLVPPDSLHSRLLESMGASYIQTLPRGEKYDLMVETASVPKLDFDLVPYLAPNGVYVITGIPGPHPPLSFDAARFLRTLVLENQILLGSFHAGPTHFKQAVLDLEAAENRWPGLLQQLITSKTHYTQFDEALQSRKPNELKAIIEWPR